MGSGSYVHVRFLRAPVTAMDAGRISSFFYGFDGRIGRRHYWIGIISVIAVLALAYFPYAVLWEAYGRSLAVYLYVYSVWAFLGLVPVMALSVKRLHDRNKSGWWILPFYFFPHWLGKLNENLPEGTALWWMTLGGGVALFLWGLVEMGFLPSTEQTNACGDVD